jgi:hypothetical protein
MKYKFSIIKDSNEKNLIVKEYAEADNDIYSLLFEQTYGQEKIETAIQLGTQELFSTIFSNSFFPAKTYADKILESITELYNSDTNKSIDLSFDDKDFLNVTDEEIDELEVIDDDDVILKADATEPANELDSLLNDKIELKVADDAAPLDTKEKA